MSQVPPSARVARRSLLATLEITGAACLAHVLAGGSVPQTGFLVAFALVLMACCAATIGRFLRVGVVIPVVLVAQVALHALMHAAPAAHHSGHGGHAAGSEGIWGSLGLTPVMVWAHVVTVLITAILLLLQERFVGYVARIWRTADLRLPVVAVLRPGAPAAVAAVFDRGDLLRIAPRRGPPVGVPATH